MARERERAIFLLKKKKKKEEGETNFFYRLKIRKIAK
jgi:hypothetical protein